MSDNIEAQRREYERKSLADWICPASGEPLVLDHPYGDAPRGRLCCEMCDCFGYLPYEVGLRIYDQLVFETVDPKQVSRVMRVYVCLCKIQMVMRKINVWTLS